MGRTVWVDITSAMTFPGFRLTGIQRVELELAARLAEMVPVEFMCFDDHHSTFVSVPERQVNDRYRELTQVAVRPRQDEVAGRLRRLRLGVEALVGRCLPRRVRTRDVESLIHTTGDATVSLLNDLSTLVVEGVRLAVHRPGRVGRSPQERWEPGDVYLCLTLHRTPEVIDRILGWAIDREVEVVALLYDMVPVVAPQFSTFDCDSQVRLFRSVFGSAAHLVAISECTARDIRSFCREEGLPCPSIDVSPPASALTRTTPRKPLDVDLPEEFILCVGTIEPRKNHHLLLDIWEDFARCGIDDSPNLVIAGSVGWLNEETMHRLRTTPELQSCVTFMDSPTDAELNWLYRNCLFTVYPSFYEGWGLPVSESLTVGKVCITSDRASLPESGRGLAIHLDPTDRRGWRSAILELMGDRPRLEDLEHRIRESYVPRTVEEVVADLERAIGR